MSLVPTDLWDGFADLLYGMTNLYGPLATNRFFFDLGADEARWVTRRIEPGPEVEVTVLLLKDMMTSPDLPDSAGEVMWRSRRPRTAFAHAAMNAAQAVLDEYGEDGYLRLCCHPFPTNALLDLRRLHRRLDACAACHRT
ncbi:hypothetical protein [Actinomadura fibrosa]|uniref:Uncharacterized protein n=1 Tax=Actinomadura fibrosa TaxID=111802 RepID=A0ABW2Y3X4_9ACTN|nr:hypothetical protein [Actinomadura fibrosa]